MSLRPTLKGVPRGYRWSKCFRVRLEMARSIGKGERADLSMSYFKYLIDRTRMSYGMSPTRVEDWL